MTLVIVLCHSDLSTCCSGSQGHHRADWYFPDGVRLPFSGAIFEGRAAQIAVIRRTTAIYWTNWNLSL